jgi:hypothetical protein
MPISGVPVVTPAEAFPELSRLRQVVASGRWNEVAAQLRAWMDTDPDAVWPAVDALVSDDGSEPLLARWADAVPDDALLNAVYAHRLVVHAWNIRSHAQAEHVTAGRFAQFHEMLGEAERRLIEVCAIEPSLGHAWAVRLLTARGLELGLSEARRRYDRLAEHNPHHFAAQQQLLQRLCPKWGGTWEQVFDFARSSARAAPAGSPCPALVAIAHFEHWVQLDGRERRHYLGGQLEELREISAGALRGYSTQFVGVTAHTVLAMVFTLAGEKDLAVPHFRTLRYALDPGFWDYLVGPDAEQLGRARRAALEDLTR